MRTSDTWICVADGHNAHFFHCNAPGFEPEPVMGVGMPRHGGAFAGRLAGQLDRAARGSLFRQLVLVGPAHVLRELEATMSAGTKELVAGEIEKNLNHASPRELGCHISHLLRH